MKKLIKVSPILFCIAAMFACDKYDLSPVTKVEINEVTSLATSATVTGNIIELSGKGNEEYGLVWAAQQEPTVDNNKVILGTPTEGNYTGNVEGLAPETTYYVRAYVADDGGMVYGETVSFETPEMPSFSLQLTAEPAEGGVMDGEGFYEAGDVVSITATPSVRFDFINWTGDTQHIDDADSPGTTVIMPYDNVSLTANFSEKPTYSLTLTANPLSGGSVYGEGEYVEDYAVHISASPAIGYKFVNWTGNTQNVDDINSANTTLTMPASNISLTADFEQLPGDGTPGDGITYHDYSYPTIWIGGREWFSENLRTAKYSNGENIPTGLDNTEWENTTGGAYAIYPHANIDGLNSETEVVNAYGILYNWYAVDDSRELCPADWSLPSDIEWTIMENYLMDEYNLTNSPDDVNGVGNNLKSARQVNHPWGGEHDTSEHPRWNSHSSHYGNDEFDFSAIPGGFRLSDGSFSTIGVNGGYWSSSESSSTTAWRRNISSEYGSFYRGNLQKSNGFSIRCFRDVD